VPFSALIDGTPVRLIGPGSDETWERAQAVKQEGRIRCRGCGGEMRTRHGASIDRHFFHKVAPDSCLLGTGEGKTHLRTKLGIAEAIEASGGEALVEHIAIDRSFVVDVLGVWNESGRQHRVAFEVQVSSQTEEVTAQRTAQRTAECDLTVWVLLRHPRAEGWPVEGLGLPGWSDMWASAWPHLRVDHALTVAGLVAHTAAGTHIQWRSTDPLRIVAAIGTGAAVWLPSESQFGHAGWVTPRLREEVARARAAAERAERREAAQREAHARNRAAFIQRQEADVEALRAGLISRAAALTWHRKRPLQAEGVRITAHTGPGRDPMDTMDFLILPASSQVFTDRCRKFINEHVVVANDPADRRRLAAERITAVSVEEALDRWSDRERVAPSSPQSDGRH
jgi:hypothetical protein